MKKALILTGVLFVLLFTFTFATYAEDYVLPEVAVPPTIDGVMNEGEWLGSCHRYMSCNTGVVYSTTNNDLGNATYDMYISWFYDGTDERSGIYFAVVAKDSSKGFGHQPSKFTAVGLSPWDGLTDKIFLGLDGYYKHQDDNSGAMTFQLVPWSNMKFDGPPICYEQSYLGITESPDAVLKSVHDDNGYVMEFFVPFKTMSVTDESVNHKVGDQIGIGIGIFDYSGEVQNYYATDFGTKDTVIFASAFRTRYYNTVTLGGIEVYPPDYVEVDRTEFLNVLHSADTYLTDSLEYSKESIDALSEAILNSSNYVYNVTPEVLQGHTDALISAINALVKRGYAETQALIAQVKALNENDYTDASWKLLDSKLAVASSMTNSNSKNDIVASYNALYAAVESLVLKSSGEHSVDTSALDAVIAEYGTLTASSFTSETWQKYQQAIDTAGSLTKTANIQSEYDSVVSSIIEARNSLKKVSAAAISSQTDGKSSIDVVLLVYIIIASVAVLSVVIIVVVKLIKKNKKKA